jgi:preprotein translocase subunit SecA
MTGTAETEANEFHDIYKLDVAVIPTNRPVIRQDNNDRIYKTRREKYGAAVDEIKGCYAKGQPVLVGTASVEASELLSRMLKREKIPHNVLNAKYHRQEAEIVARAGQRGTVTISTNMAGRGTDIKLGDGVPDLGGLHVLGTERHESRRVDRQLRGRCARQGDPGSSRFYVSFEDDLMRNFGASEKMTSMMERFGLKDGEELEHPWLNKSVETAQKRVEQRNYLIRKRTLDFDDVMNKQREVVYALRNETLETTEPRKLIFEIVDEVIPLRVQEYLQPADGSEPDYDGMLQWVNTTFPLGLSGSSAQFETRSPDENSQFLVDRIKQSYQRKVSHEESEAVAGLERYIILNAIDRLWQEHLYAMDGLREGIYLRSYGQKDPLVEYKTEAYDMFSQLMASIKNEVLSNLFRSTTNLMAFEQFLSSLPFNIAQRTEPGQPARPAAGPLPRREHLGLARNDQGDKNGDELELVIPTARREAPKVGRNDPCPCGSGKKYKNCCGRLA